MEAKYLTCANLLVEEKCSKWIILNVNSKAVVELKDSKIDETLYLGGDLDFKKVNIICSECNNYLTK